MVRVLVFSTLYPNAAQRNHGVFVENRLRKTVGLGGIDATVLAPVPYFPVAHPIFGRYAAFARAPKHEIRSGLEVWHPRYLAIPRVGAGLAPDLLYRAGLSAVRNLARRGLTFDVIDAHYFYPDGVAAALLGEALQLPVVITARGTDLTLIPTEAGPRARIKWAIQHASASVAVCNDLGRRLVALGASEKRTIVLRNGVDLELFTQADRQAARTALDINTFTVLSVGSLIPRKGHHLAIEAIALRADCALLIAGGGPQRAELEALARRLGVDERVRFLGDVPHRDLPRLYAAADVLLLASEREGWANVLLEAMACGTPVIATDVNGTSEVVRSSAAGRLIPRRTPEAIIDTLDDLRRDLPHRQDTRSYAEQFSWEPIARANRTLLTAAARAGYAGRFDDKIVGEARAQLTGAAEPNSC